MLRPCRLALLAAALAIPLTTGVAAAQGRSGPALDPARKLEAKRHFDRGADLYAQGSYDEAIAEWLRSFEISGHPLIFESVANAQERLGRPREARESLMKWRDAAPREEHELLDRRLRNLDERIARLEEEERAAALKKAAEEEEAARRRAADPATGTDAASAEEAGSPLVPIGLVVGGIGLGAIVGGLVVGGIASGERPDEAEACRASGEESLCLGAQRDAIESSSSLALVADLLWIGGALATATGAVLVVVGSGDEGTADDGPGDPAGADTARAVLAPSVAPGGAGFTLRGAF